MQELIEAKLLYPNLIDYGHKIGKLFTDFGLPIDMALDRLDINKTQKLAVLQGSLEEIIEHKRRSGATEKAIDRTRESNKQAIYSFIKTNEVGIY